MQDAINTLAKIVPKNCFLVDSIAKKPHETEWRKRYFNPSIGVIFPTSITQIQQIIKTCRDNQIGIVPQGGNTSACAGAIPIQSKTPQLILNLTKLNKVLEIDVENSSICVESGCSLYQVQKVAAKHELYFPLSMGSAGSCQIGGNIATNAGGIHVIKYGMMRELVLGIEAILPDGTIINQLKNLRKNNINFDLKQLFIGSEGTIGIITKANLKLFPKINQHVTGLIGVESILIAINMLNLLKLHYSVCAFEIINRLTQQIYNTHFSNNPFIVNDEWAVLFEIEIQNNFNLDKFNTLLKQLDIDSTKGIIASNESERQALWSFRENIPLAEKMAGIAINHDISLPISKIEAFILDNQKNNKAQYPQAQIIIFGHLGDGNLHYNIQINQCTQEKLQSFEQNINSIVYNDVARYNGSFSAEHGIGSLKKSWMIKYYDSSSYSLAKSIKKLIDPQNIFNPGKLF